jgi:hypothetical protein
VRINLFNGKFRSKTEDLEELLAPWKTDEAD